MSHGTFRGLKWNWYKGSFAPLILERNFFIHPHNFNYERRGCFPWLLSTFLLPSHSAHFKQKENRKKKEKNIISLSIKIKTRSMTREPELFLSEIFLRSRWTMINQFTVMVNDKIEWSNGRWKFWTTFMINDLNFCRDILHPKGTKYFGKIFQSQTGSAKGRK